MRAPFRMGTPPRSVPRPKFLGRRTAAEKTPLFLELPGAPLDNNVCERALKMSIRHRKNSLFYRTTRGAEVGDIYMSLIHTCYSAKADPFHYLTQLQRHHLEVIESPSTWLPWTCGRQSAAA